MTITQDGQDAADMGITRVGVVHHPSPPIPSSVGAHQQNGY